MALTFPKWCYLLQVGGRMGYPNNVQLQALHPLLNYNILSFLNYSLKKQNKLITNYQTDFAFLLGTKETVVQLVRWVCFRGQGWDSPTLNFCYLSFLLVTSQWKTLLEEKTVMVELDESQPRQVKKETLILQK